MSVLFDRVVVGPGKSEVSEFYSEVLPVDQDVLRLEIPMNDSVGMAEL